MNIVKYGGFPPFTFCPRHPHTPLHQLVESMFDDFFSPLMSRQEQDGIGAPRLNVEETDKEFAIEAELPGVKKEDIKISIDNRRVTLEGEVKRESKQEEGKNTVYAERFI